MKLPYGDQGLFLQRPLFEALGGFPDWPILEDLEMVRRLKRRGALAIEPALACTSGRRWLRRGLWTTLWINQLVLVGYWCGVSRERLATFYRGSASGDSLK